MVTRKSVQRGWRKLAEAATALNTPKCSQSCGRPAVREAQGFGAVCGQCYKDLGVILNEKKGAGSGSARGGSRRKPKRGEGRG